MQVGTLTIDIAANVARLQSDMAKVERTVTSGFSRIDGAARAAALALGGIFGGLSVAGVAGYVRNIVNDLDEVGKAAQRAGFESAQAFESYAFAAKLSGVESAGFETAVGKLSSKMADAAGGGKEAAAVFAAMGIKVKDAGGALRSSEQVLGDLAAKFATYADGAEKSALAADLFGDRAGRQMIPLLNGGREGVAALRKEFGGLAGVMRDDAYKEAERFNDNLDRMAVQSKALGRSLAAELLPTINKLVEDFIEVRKQGLLLNVVFDQMKTVFGGNRLSNNPLADPAGDIASMMKERARLTKRMEFAQRQGLPTRDIQGELDEVGEMMQFARARQARAALAGASGDMGDAVSRRLKRGTVAAPVVPKSGAAGSAGADPYDALESSLERHIALLQAEADAMAPLTEAQRWEAQELAKIADKLKELGPLRAAELAARVNDGAALMQEMEARRAAAALAKQQEADRERAAQQMESGNRSIREGNQALREEIETMGLSELAIGAIEQARISSAIAIKEEAFARREADSVMQGGDGTLALLGEEIRLLRERQALVGQKYAVADQTRRDTEERAANAARAKALEDSITDGILNGFRNGQSLGDIFLNELKAQFAKAVLQPVISPIAAAGSAMMSQLFGGLFGSLFGGATAYNVPSSFQPLDASFNKFLVNHSGGMVGVEGTYRSASPAIFEGADRYHGGGLVAGEVPIIAKEGEGVFTQEQMKALAPAGSAGPNITYAPVIKIDSRSDRGAVMVDVQRALRENNQALMMEMQRRGVVPA